MLNAKKLVILAIFLLLAAVLYFSSMIHARYQRSEVEYQIPEVTLYNQQGQPVELRSYLASDKPIMLEFIFTSCTTLCPNQAVKFAKFQKKLAPEIEQVQLVSITVDPETDTPEVLRHYLQQFHAQPGWDFLTGSKQDIKQVMTAFGIKASDMITHDSSLLLRAPKTGQWTRIDGQLETGDFLLEYQLLQE